MTSAESAYLTLHSRHATDRLLYGIYWGLVILSWPIRLVGACGFGVSFGPVLFGKIKIGDPNMHSAITGTSVGAAIFGVGYGCRFLADLLATRTFSAANSFKLGKSYSGLQKNERAVLEFSRAVRKCPEMTAARLYRAVCNAALSKQDEAEQEIVAVLEQHPDWARAHFARAFMHGARQQYKEARTHLGNALAVSEKALQQKPESLGGIFRMQDAFALMHVPVATIKQAISQFDAEAAKAMQNKAD